MLVGSGRSRIGRWGGRIGVGPVVCLSRLVGGVVHDLGGLVLVGLAGWARLVCETYIANHAVVQRFVGGLVEFCAACYADEEVWAVGRCGGSHGGLVISH